MELYRVPRPVAGHRVEAEQIQPGDIVVAAITAECTDGYLGARDLVQSARRTQCIGF
jgi:hypothetical protein